MYNRFLPGTLPPLYQELHDGWTSTVGPTRGCAPMITRRSAYVARAWSLAHCTESSTVWTAIRAMSPRQLRQFGDGDETLVSGQAASGPHGMADQQQGEACGSGLESLVDHQGASLLYSGRFHLIQKTLNDGSHVSGTAVSRLSSYGAAISCRLTACEKVRSPRANPSFVRMRVTLSPCDVDAPTGLMVPCRAAMS
jgi:hypothetical protein